MPKVSIIITTYNCAKYLPEALQSALDQTFDDLEIIIVDDGSTDNTRNIVSSYESEKIRYIFLENCSGGPPRPRNVGIKAAESKYLSFFDADDIMVPDKTARAVALLDSEPGLGMVFADFVNFDEENGLYKNTFLSVYDSFRSLRKRYLGNDCYVIKGRDAFETLFCNIYISSPSVVIPKDVFVNIGGFDESIVNAEDIDMWMRITKNYDIGFIDKVSFSRRLHEDNIIFRGINVREDRINAMSKHLTNELSPFARQHALKYISTNHFEIGYLHQQEGRMKEARTHYLACAQAHFMRSVLRGIIITFIPPKIFFFLKKILGRE